MSTIPDLTQPAGWLPVVFMALMGIAVLAYVVLDGYDLGVGILLRRADDAEKDTMIASIGPFWDANETWLVLGVGLLLVAFPAAHGEILGALYLPVALMLFGLILRGVAFDFRVKARAHHKPWWNRAFYAGSVIATAAQGLMLGLYITGFQYDAANVIFAICTAGGLIAGYLWFTALGVAAVSLATPWVSTRVFDKWFALPNIILLAPVPLVTIVLFLLIDWVLRRLPQQIAKGDEHLVWAPFVGTGAIFLLAFNGLAYSLFPYLVVDRLDIWQAASAPESLEFMLVGVAIVLPTIVGYTIYSYKVFHGKATELRYY